MIINDMTVGDLTDTITKVKFGMLQKTPNFVSLVGGELIYWDDEDGSNQLDVDANPDLTMSVFIITD